MFHLGVCPQPVDPGCSGLGRGRGMMSGEIKIENKKSGTKKNKKESKYEGIDIVPRIENPEIRLADHEKNPTYIFLFAKLLEVISILRNASGFMVLMQILSASIRGHRPLTWGEVFSYLVYARSLSGGAAKKIIKKLKDLDLIVSVPSPCIDRAADICASRKLSLLVPIIAKKYTVYRTSLEGFMERTKFDASELREDLCCSENLKIAKWFQQWCKLTPSPTECPTSLKPFLGPEYLSIKSPCITAIVDVSETDPRDFKFLLCDNLALEDKPFAAAARVASVGSLPSKMISQVTKADFQAAKELRWPQFHHLKGVVNGVSHDYFRLILPFSVIGEKVDIIMIISELTKSRGK
jgi:hypothetical protein